LNQHQDNKKKFRSNQSNHHQVRGKFVITLCRRRCISTLVRQFMLIQYLLLQHLRAQRVPNSILFQWLITNDSLWCHVPPASPAASPQQSACFQLHPLSWCRARPFLPHQQHPFKNSNAACQKIGQQNRFAPFGHCHGEGKEEAKPVPLVHVFASTRLLLAVGLRSSLRSCLPTLLLGAWCAQSVFSFLFNLSESVY